MEEWAERRVPSSIRKGGEPRGHVPLEEPDLAD